MTLYLTFKFERLKLLHLEVKSLEKQLEVSDLFSQEIICDKIMKHYDEISLIKSNLNQIKLEDLSSDKDKDLVSQYIIYKKK